MEVLNSLYTGVVYGTVLAEHEQLAEGVSKLARDTGHSTVSAAFKSMREISFSATFTTQVWGFSTFGGICLQLVCMLAIGALTCGFRELTTESYRLWCAWFADKMLTVSQASPIVNVLALLWFGNFVLGGAVCIMYAVSYLNEKNKLGPIQAGYRYVIKNPCFLCATLLVTSGLARIMVVADIVCLVYQLYNSLFSDSRSAEIRNEREGQPENFTLNINNDTINLAKGNFQGNVSDAMNYLQDFCTKNTIRYQSLGLGYGKLFVNQKLHNITPYGIDLKMMLRYCGNKKPSDFP